MVIAKIVKGAVKASTMKRLVRHDSKMKRQKKAKFLATTASAKAKVAKAKVKLAESKATKAQAEAVRAKERSFHMMMGNDPIDYLQYKSVRAGKAMDEKSYLKSMERVKARNLVARDRRRVVEQTQKQHRTLQGHLARSKLNFKTVDTGIFFQNLDAKTKPYVFGKGVKGKHSKPMSLQLKETVKFQAVTQTKSGIKKRFGDLKRTASERKQLPVVRDPRQGFFIALGTRRNAWGVVRDDGKTKLIRVQPHKRTETELKLKRPTANQSLWLGLGGIGTAGVATQDWSKVGPFMNEVKDSLGKKKPGRR